MTSKKLTGAIEQHRAAFEEWTAAPDGDKRAAAAEVHAVEKIADMQMSDEADFLAALRHLAAYDAQCGVEEPMQTLVRNYFALGEGDYAAAREVPGVTDWTDERLSA